MYQALPSRLHVKDSPVAGQGIFALEEIPVGMVLGMSHIIIDDVIYRTPLGGFINHSEKPNCHLIISQDWDDFIIYNVVTHKKILKDEEILLDYEV